MHKPTPVVVALALAASSFAATALADLPPAPDYVEPCSVDKQQSDGELCQLCGGAWHGDTEKCAKDMAGTPFQRRCKTSGASTWDEVWCRKATDAEVSSRPPPPPPVPQSGCSGGGCAIGTGAGGAAGGAALLLLALAAWRRRR